MWLHIGLRLIQVTSDIDFTTTKTWFWWQYWRRAHMLHRFGIKSFSKLHKIFRQYVVRSMFSLTFSPIFSFLCYRYLHLMGLWFKGKVWLFLLIDLLFFSIYGAHFLRCWNWAYLPSISSPPYDRKLHKIVFWSVSPYSFYSSQLAGLPSYDLWKQIWTSSVELKSSCDCLMAT